MTASLLRERVTFQQMNTTSDGQGGQTINSWDDVATLWAEVRPVNSRERWFAQQVNKNTTHIIRIRHNTAITTAMRASFGGRIFSLTGKFNEGERDKFDYIEAVEGAGN